MFGNSDIVLMCLQYFHRYGLIGARTLPLYFCYFWVSWCHYDIFLQFRRTLHRRQGRRAQERVDLLASSGTKIYVAPNLLLIAMEKLCSKKVKMNEVENAFEVGISACAKVGCWFFQAVATEKLAKYFLQYSNEHEKGMRYLQDAINLYKKWGACKKEEGLANFPSNFQL
jgi:hypothetical protein